MNIFAIGDIHGCLKQLISLQEKILNSKNFKKDKDLFVYIGDYIDRGLKSKDVINLWHRVQLAYQGGDLDELRSLIIILESKDKTAKLPSSRKTLERRKKGLTEQIQKIIGKLSDMKKEFPFTIAKNLSDKKWVESKLEEIGDRIRHFEDKCKEYNELLRVLLVSKETGVN